MTLPLLLLACSSSPAPSGGADPEAPGVLVLAGGGTEGEVGDASAWSARLYGALLEGGDVTGDGRVRVVVLSTAEETDWLPQYLVWLGADEAENLRVGSREQAQAADPSEYDAAFLKGGDQGEYYDLWNDTALEDGLLALHARGGGIGGTSAGAMSQSQWALAGGQDLVSDDVLADSHSPYLDDADGGSGVHDDFLGLLPGALVDTHFTERGRLGRLLGAMALAREQGAPDDLLGVGLEQQTGIVVRDGVVTVHGVGGVSLLRGGSFVREDGVPLRATDVTLQVLTEGGRFDLDRLDLDSGEGMTRPDGAVDVTPTAPGASEAAAWAVDGDLRTHEERCAFVAERDPRPFTLRAGQDAPLLDGAICLTGAHESDDRATVQEAALAALAAAPGAGAFLVAFESSLERAAADGDTVRFADNPEVDGAERATIVLDGSAVEWTSASPLPSPYDLGDGSLHAVGLGPLTVHVLADSAGTGVTWDQRARAVIGW
ncbi:cyanophycinase [Myxococcota bacterium]|nr:cyanophycinase [Myxococcota bacterium]